MSKIKTFFGGPKQGSYDGPRGDRPERGPRSEGEGSGFRRGPRPGGGGGGGGYGRRPSGGGGGGGYGRSSGGGGTYTRREPQPVETPRLHVGNLSFDTSESDLFDLFSQVGPVKNVALVIDKRTNRSKGFGFVEMESLELAKEAAAKYHETEFMGRKILVSGATPPENRENRYGDNR